MNLPDQDLPPGFEALPEAARRQITEQGQAFGDRAVSHLVQIIIGPPANVASGARVNHASGVQILIDSHRYLITAAHVVRLVADRVRANEPILVQVGNALVPVLDRIVWLDEALDLVFIQLNPEETCDIPALCWIPSTWPPEPPVEGEYVAFAGFPRRYREDVGPGEVVLNAVGALLRVESASDRRLTSVVPREDLVLTKGPEIPPKGSELGGMSGGPVFRISGDELELVAVIKEDSVQWDAYFFVPFTNVQLDHAARISI